MLSMGTVGTIAIAGCSSSGSGNADSSDSTGNSGSDMGPEDTAEQYYKAIIEADIETANDLLHPESEIYPAEEGDFEAGNVTLVSTEELSLSEFAERDSSIDSEEEALDQVQDAIDETGADSLAIVWVTFREDGETNEGPLFVAEVDDSFKILI